MKLPFTIDQFMEIFARYNLAIWPGQIIAYLLGAAALFFAIRRAKHSDKMISAILSLFWIWNGVAYHLYLWFAPSFSKKGTRDPASDTLLLGGRRNLRCSIPG